MKIEWNKENNTITVGKAVFDEFTQFKSSAEFANAVFKQHDMSFRLNVCAKNSKDANKFASDTLGCSRSVLFKHFNKLQEKVFIAPIYPILAKVAFSRRGWNIQAIRKITAHKELMQQVFDDGLYNILPIVLTTGKSPEVLKGILKGKWKIVANNSLHRNKAIADMPSLNSVDVGYSMLATTAPTTLIKSKVSNEEDVLQYLTKNFKGKWKDTSMMSREARLVTECMSQARQLDKKISFDWSARRMKEEHENMTKELHARKYSKDKFDSTKDISVKYLKCGDYVATLLESAFDIADEGTAMGHCVGLYAESSRDGNYLVYSVTKNGERSSTIGINISKPTKYLNTNTGRSFTEGKYRFNQHYGRFNAALKDEDEIKLGQVIVDMLNKEI